jgi:ATP-dependent Clp protease protease subunit
VRAQLNELLAEHTGQSVDQIAKDTERDNFMDPQQAMNYGLIDKVFENRKVDSGE